MSAQCPEIADALILRRLLNQRRSCRAFSTRSIPAEIIDELFRMASSAPSSSNHQPWRVYMVNGDPLQQLSSALTHAFLEAGEEAREFPSPDRNLEPYKARRREAGLGMYGRIGIDRGDRAASREFIVKNYNFFGAPVGLVFCCDERLGPSAFLDLGLFMQSLMLSAIAYGLGTCAQGSIAYYPRTIRRHIDIPEAEVIVCGMALGYPEVDAVVNSYQPSRVSILEFLVKVGN